MELDDKELEATRNRNKSADEMFEELGYKKIYKKIDEDDSILYIKVGMQQIKFNKTNEIVESIFPQRIKIKELQAINKKVEELGWK